MKHTPGPWYYDPAYGYVRTVGRHATVLEASELFPNQHANGQLAATAPELLAALEDLEVILSGKPYDRDEQQRIIAARAAIEKARKQPSEVECDRTNMDRVATALGYLNSARKLLRDAKAVKTLERVQLAISSGKGALRHARLEPYRTERQAAARGGK